jgi:tetratricopeptide (TPR) repeat protein
MGNLAGSYTSQGRWAESEALLTDVVKRSREVLGREHPHSLSYLNNLAGLYDSQGRNAEAEPLYLEVLEISRSKLGQDHRSTLIVMNNLAGIYTDLGRHDSAERLYREVLETRRRVLGPQNPETIGSLNNLGFLLMKLRRYDEAEPCLKEALEGFETRLGAEHPSTLIAKSNLEELQNQSGSPQKGEEFNRIVLEACRRIFPSEHWFLGTALRRLGVSLALRKRYSEAERYLLESYQVLSKAFDGENERTQSTVQELVRLYDRWKKPDRLAEWNQKVLQDPAVEIRAATLRVDGTK